MKSRSVLLGAVVIALLAGLLTLIKTENIYAQVDSYPDEYSFSYRTQQNALNPNQIYATPANEDLPVGDYTWERYEQDLGTGPNTDETTYVNAIGSASTAQIRVANCTGAATIYFVDNTNASLSIGGTPNYFPCNTNPEENGSLEVSVLLANFQDVENPEEFSPIRFTLLDSSGTEVGSDAVDIATASNNTIVASFDDVAEGTYTVVVSAGAGEVGRENNVEVTAGTTTSIDMSISLEDFEEGAGITQEVGEQTPTCESENKSIGWILCPIMVTSLDILDDLSSGVLEGLLVLDFDQNQTEVLRSIWNGFRVIANLGFIIAFFVIIYSAATGNVISAYDVKRLLPRLVVGVVAVQLSFFVSMELIQVFNDIGLGIAELLLSPLPDSAAGISGLFSNSPLGDGDSALLALAGIGFAILFIALLIIVAWGAIGGILLMMGVFLIRSMILVLMIVLSPIAFVAWILPGTNQIFTLWWKWFIQLLAIFPIAAAFFAAGKLLGAIWIGAGAGASWAVADGLAVIIGTVAIFAPYFMAPFMFKFAGSAVQSIVGGVNAAKDKFGESESYQRSKASIQSGNSWMGRAGKAFQKPTNHLNTKASRRQRAMVAETHRKFQDTDTAASQILLQEEIAQRKAKAPAGSNPMDVERDFLREVVSDTSRSDGERRAAFTQLATVHGGDIETSETLRLVVEEANVSGDRQQIELATQMIQENIGTLLKDMPTVVKPKASSAASVPTEKVVEMRDGTVQAIAFDEREGVAASAATNVSLATKFSEAADSDRLRGQVDTASVEKLYSSLKQKRANSSYAPHHAELDAAMAELEARYDLVDTGDTLDFSGIDDGSDLSKVTGAKKYKASLK